MPRCSTTGCQAVVQSLRSADDVRQKMGHLKRHRAWGFHIWLIILIGAFANCSDKGTPQGPAPSQGPAQSSTSINLSLGDVNLTMREIVSQHEDMQSLRPAVDIVQDIRVTLQDSLMIFPLPDSGWGGRRESNGSTTAWITIRLRPSRLQVVEAVVALGELRFDMRNNMPENVGIKLYFQDFVRGEMLEWVRSHFCRVGYDPSFSAGRSGVPSHPRSWRGG